MSKEILNQLDTWSSRESWNEQSASPPVSCSGPGGSSLTHDKSRMFVPLPFARLNMPLVGWVNELQQSLGRCPSFPHLQHSWSLELLSCCSLSSKVSNSLWFGVGTFHTRNMRCRRLWPWDHFFPLPVPVPKLDVSGSPVQSFCRTQRRFDGGHASCSAQHGVCHQNGLTNKSA